MLKVFSCDNIIQAGLVKSRLEEYGIPCLLKNESLAGGIGELPPIECWPEVWITNDADRNRAESIVDSMQECADGPGQSWRCRCGETIEGQFTHCWNCGREFPADV